MVGEEVAEGETHKYEDLPFPDKKSLGARGDGVNRFPESVDQPRLMG